MCTWSFNQSVVEGWICLSQNPITPGSQSWRNYKKARARPKLISYLAGPGFDVCALFD